MAIAAAPIHRITVEQVVALEAAGLLEERRMELVDGILFDVGKPNPPHSHTVAFLTRHLPRELPDHLELLVQDALFVHAASCPRTSSSPRSASSPSATTRRSWSSR